MPGPAPKRSEQRRRRNKTDVETSKGLAADELHWPDPDPEWHPLAVDWYLALRTPSIEPYLQATDVAQARVVAHMLSEQLQRPGGIVANAIGPLFSAMAELLTTEGARRRLRIEIERREPQDEAPVLDIVDRRRALASGD